MSKISIVMFDLSGTTVHDDTGVRELPALIETQFS